MRISKNNPREAGKIKVISKNKSLPMQTGQRAKSAMSLSLTVTCLQKGKKKPDENQFIRHEQLRLSGSSSAAEIFRKFSSLIFDVNSTHPLCICDCAPCPSPGM
jgi:hypothetical protein